MPKGGDTVNGVFVPEGTAILTSIWAIGRNKVFGPHPEVYRPERWLEADKEREKQMQANVDLVFGYGRTSCMGKGIAVVELNKILFEVSDIGCGSSTMTDILSQIFRRFDITLLNPLKPLDSEMYNIFLQRDMMVRISARHAS